MSPIRSFDQFVAKSLIFGLAFVLSVFGPISVRVAEAQSVGSVSGTVTNANGDPVAGVRVGIYALFSYATTNANGTYTISDVPHSVGPYDVQLLAPCTRDQSKRVEVEGAETLDFTIAVQDKRAGYTCTHTTAPYIDGTTTLALSGDDEMQQVNLPFSLPFFGSGYTSAFVTTNGYLTFTNQSIEGFSPAPLPSTDGPNAAIYAFHDDLIVDGLSMRTTSGGLAPNRFFVIEWLGARFFGLPAEVRVSVEAVLFENGHIVFHYNDITPGLAGEPREQGSLALVGIENQDGTAAFQRSWRQPYLQNGLGIEFAPASK